MNQENSMEREDIIRLEFRLIDGIKSSDIGLLDALLHNDLLFIAPNGQTITKQIDLQSHREGAMQVETLVPTIEDIQIMGDTAVVVVVYDTKGTMLGKPIAGKFKYIRFWKQFPDGIQVIGGSCFQLSASDGEIHANH
jgi:ketosteroid isomerase-like protein